MIMKFFNKIFKKKEKVLYSQYFECWFYKDDFEESEENV